MEQDPTAYACETCPVRLWQARLSEADRLAMDAYTVLGRPAVQAMGLTPLVLQAWPALLTPEQAIGFVRRLVRLRESDERRARAQAARERDDG